MAQTKWLPITPPGTAITDPVAVEYLHTRSPKALQIAQRLLVDCEKAVQRKGIFQTDRSREDRVLKRLSDLENQLRQVLA